MPATDWKTLYMNKGTGFPIFGTDLASWPGLNSHGDSTTARDITIDSRASPAIDGGGATIPAGCLPNGNNATDPDGFYHVRNLSLIGNIKVNCPNVPLAGDHTFPLIDGKVTSTNAITTFRPGPDYIQVGSTVVRYETKVDATKTFEGCTGGNPWKPTEIAGLANIVQQTKVRLRYCYLTNKTPDPDTFLNNDLNNGNIDTGTDQGAIWDVQHLHLYCSSTAGAIRIGRSQGFFRNFFIERALKDCCKATNRAVWIRFANGTVFNHPESNQEGLKRPTVSSGSSLTTARRPSPGFRPGNGSCSTATTTTATSSRTRTLPRIRIPMA
jgi:hypothetical protein